MGAATAESDLWRHEPLQGGQGQIRELLGRLFARLELGPMGITTLLRTVRLEPRPPRRRLRGRSVHRETTYLVVEGVVRLQCRAERRRRPLIVDLLGPGDFVRIPPEPIGGASDDLAFYTHERVLLAQFEETVLRRVLLAASPERLLEILDDLHQRDARRLADKSCLLACTVEERIASSIRALAARFGAPEPDGRRIEVALTCANWADLVGCERANATRALQRLEQRGAIRREHQHVVMLDPEALGVGPRRRAAARYETGSRDSASSVASSPTGRMRPSCSTRRI